MQRGFPALKQSALVLALIISVAAFAGCSREAEVTEIQTPVPEATPPTNAMPPGALAPAGQGAALDVPAGADTATILAELEREVRKWILRNRRAPQSFEEFISSTPLQIPPPPPGKKYVLTREMKVILGNR